MCDEGRGLLVELLVRWGGLGSHSESADSSLKSGDLCGNAVRSFSSVGAGAAAGQGRRVSS